MMEREYNVRYRAEWMLVYDRGVYLKEWRDRMNASILFSWSMIAETYSATQIHR